MFRTRTAHRRTSAPGRAVACAGAVLLALSLAACGDDPETPATGDAIILPGAGPTDRDRGSEDDGPQDRGAEPMAPTVTDDDAELDVDDQGGDGSQVVIDEARLTSGVGLVVVVDPVTRAVLGSVAIPQGGARDLRVPLSPAVTGSRELVAMLYADDGDGEFDPSRDGRIVEDDGDAETEDFDYTVR